MIERSAITVYFRIDKTRLFRNLHLTRTIRIIVAASWMVVGCMWHLSSAPVGSANPVNPAVVAGEATVSGVGTDLVTIQQASQHAVIHWSQFNIAPSEVTSFLQPVGGIALNRIFDASPSLINGALNATGTVFLLNPNGVLFGPNAQVNVGGLVASTLHMTDADFLAGIYRFGGPATHLGLGDTAFNGMVRNEGEITAGPFGAYLFAHNVENAGIIRSPNGHIALAAGASAYLSNRPDGRGLFVEVTAPTGQATNLKDLVADGGQVSLFGKVVNQSGLIQANSVQQRKGRIELVATDAVTLADGSRTLARGDATGVSQGGTVIVKAGLQTGQTNFKKGALIDVSGSTKGGHGGFIELSASRVTWEGAFRAHALSGYRGGKLLIDPIFDGNSPITTSMLSGLTDQVINSGLNDIEFQSTGDLNVTARFDLSEWLLPAGQTGTLTFNAGQNLLFNNASITNGERGLGVAGSRWDYRLFANQHIEIKGSVLSTGAGGTITMEAGRSPTTFGDIRLLQTGPGLPSQPIIETFAGGDITITTDRDLIAPSGLVEGVVTGIRLNELGNLTLNVGRDFLGGGVGTAKISPGFLLGNGRATIKVGLNVGTGPTQHPTGGNIGSTDAYANITVGGGRIDENGKLIEAFKTEVRAEAPGHIYWGLVQDRGVVEDLFQIGDFYVTSHPDSNVSLLSSAGNIFLKPLISQSVAGDRDKVRLIYPASLDAQAPNGNIIIESHLTFFPSLTGRLNFSAKNDITGVTKSVGFRKDPRYQLVYIGNTFPGGAWRLLDLQTAGHDPFLSQYIHRAPPRAALNIKPSESSFSPQEWPEIPTFQGAPVVKILQGDVKNLQGIYSDSQFSAKQLVLPQNVNPNHQVQDVKFKATSGDIHTLQIEALSPVFKKKVTVEAGRDIGTNFDVTSNTLTGGDFTLIASIPEGVTATVAAGRNMGFRRRGVTQTGLEYFGRGTAKVRVGALDSEGNPVPNTGNLDLGDGRGIQHRSQNFGESNAPGLIDIGVGNNLTMTQTRIVSHNGASVWIHGLGTKPALNSDGSPTGELVQGAINPVTKVLMVDGRPVKVEGLALVLDGTQPVISQGTLVLDRPGEQINGKTFSPVIAKGKPIFVDGRIVLLVDGQIQLVDASLVSIEQASGGKLTVGTFGSDPTSGILTIRGGNIDIKTRGDVDVFRSRVATLTGGNVSIYSVVGDINAGSGGRNESIQFAVQQQGKDANGNDLPDLVFSVPGSGIFTHHGDDPKFPLNFPKFDTPQITALKGEIAKHNFLGRDTTSLENQVSKLVAQREPEYRQIFEQFITQNPGKPEVVNGVPTGRFLPLELGDINLRAGQDLVVPSAGIRGRRIRISAGRNLDLQGGTVEGEVQFDVAGSVKGNLSSFVGAFSGTSAIGGSVSGGASAGGSSLGGGLSGVTGTVAATASSTSSSSGTASKTVEAVQEKAAESSTQQAKAAAQNQTAASQDEQRKGVQTVKVKRGVVIQVDVKPEVKPVS